MNRSDRNTLCTAVCGILSGYGAHLLLKGVETVVIGSGIGLFGRVGIAIFHVAAVFNGIGLGIKVYDALSDMAKTTKNAFRKSVNAYKTSSNDTVKFTDEEQS